MFTFIKFILVKNSAAFPFSSPYEEGDVDLGGCLLALSLLRINV